MQLYSVKKKLRKRFRNIHNRLTLVFNISF